MPFVQKLLTPYAAVAATAILSAGAVGVFYASVNRQPAGSYVSAHTGPIVEEVDTTGTVKAAENVDLAFQVGGKIANAGPHVGTHVGAGATLATLTHSDQAASVEQARAALQVQEANLASLEAGDRPEDLAVSQAAVNGAQSALAQAQQSVIQAAQDAYEKADDAIHNKVDQFFNNPRSGSPLLVLTLSNSQLQNSMTTGRYTMETLLNTWQQYLAALPSDPGQVPISTLEETTRDNLNQVNSYLDTVAAGLTTVVPTTQYPTATIQTYQSSVTAARAAISADIGSINAAETAEKGAESALATAKSQLGLKQAPATPQAIAAQEAQVALAQAALDSAEAQFGKTVISAPISGTITVNNAHAGEIAVAGSPVISMISDSAFQFETYVSEADLAKLKIGQAARVELDAYENGQPSTARVVAIDPAATMQNGASTYKVTLQFDAADPRIQAGLTGSVKITTASFERAIVVPSSAIITRGADHFVLRKGKGGDEETPVQIGISSADGFTQIMSGLSDGDQIRSFGGN